MVKEPGVEIVIYKAIIVIEKAKSASPNDIVSPSGTSFLSLVSTI